MSVFSCAEHWGGAVAVSLAQNPFDDVWPNVGGDQRRHRLVIMDAIPADRIRCQATGPF